ncbi:MAG: 23S rRNA (uracil(1939)-C(5))-methyltransferase RlmD [Zetaproteobacteria bacterium]|nr:MAG: 23S rRNA (uracil(1939)-C(5))-methyltransferase RlmD [Zetaproteobacteria bacterium]
MEAQPLISGYAERLLPGGEALVRNQNKQFLISNAVPGDTVQCRIEGKRRGMLRGRVEARIHASTMRVEANCEVAGKCGGCALQFLDPACHAAVKSAWVREAFSSFFDPETVWRPIHGKAECGQRRRARWWRAEDSDGIFLGFRARGSHEVVRAPTCQMVSPEIDALRLHIQHGIPDSVESVQVTRLSDGMHVVFEARAEDVDTDTARHLATSMMELSLAVPIIPWWRSSSATVPLHHPVKILHDRVPAGDTLIQLPVGPDDFVQGHATDNADMVQQVQEWAGSPRFVADFFCGIGNLSLPLAYHANTGVRGADATVSSIRLANASAKKLGVDAHYEAINLFEAFDISAFAGADVLILDPPRKGAKRICRSMGTLLPASIIMVNCDVASGARDASELYKTGYRLRALRAFDLFPYSGHVEAMSLWRR